MLGVGGGASILQLQHLLNPERICGIELNAMHLQIAARFFSLDKDLASLHQADARSWLEDYKGSCFDMIVDDLFTDEKSEPVRAFAADSLWFRKLLKALSVSGVLVINFASMQEFRECGCFSNKTISRHFRSVFRITNPSLDNVVGVFARDDVSSSGLRKTLTKHPLLGRALQSKKLRYQIRRIT